MPTIREDHFPIKKTGAMVILLERLEQLEQIADDAERLRAGAEHLGSCRLSTASRSPEKVVRTPAAAFAPMLQLREAELVGHWRPDNVSRVTRLLPLGPQGGGTADQA